MPFKWKCKGQTKYSPDDLKRAVLEVVNDNKGLRPTAKKYNVDKMTLKRYVSKYQEDRGITFSPNFVTAQIFSTHEESLLMEFLLTSANLQSGLTPKQIRKFAYQFGRENNKKLPDNWKKNECASYDWLRGFMSRHPQLSSRSLKGFEIADPFDPNFFDDLDFAGAEGTNRPYQEEDQNSEKKPDINYSTTQPGTSSSTTSALLKSTDEVRPDPKAQPPKEIGDRNPCRTRIFTDTPEKKAIEAEYNMREEKKTLKIKKLKIAVETETSDNFEQHSAGCSKSHLKGKVSSRNTKTEENVFDDLDQEDENEKDPFSDEDDDPACIYCNSLFSASRPREQWIRCLHCLKWCHSACACVVVK